MSVFSKLKNIFYDEVVVEDEQEVEEEKEIKPKIEEIKYKRQEEKIEPITLKEEPKPKEEVKEENTFSERELFKNERTFNFTEFDEEEELPQRRNVLDTNLNKVNDPVTSETPKVFKPSPVISPIYGILDKDYKKEEIKSKPVVTDTLTSNVTKYDTVRKKAYGTLEDELEDTLNSINSVSTIDIKKEIDKVDKEVEKLEKTSKIEDLISKIDDATRDLTDELDKNLTIGELETKEEESLDEDNIDHTLTDSTLEHDLFNLIDSMYDKEN